MEQWGPEGGRVLSHRGLTTFSPWHPFPSPWNWSPKKGQAGQRSGTLVRPAERSLPPVPTTERVSQLFHLWLSVLCPKVKPISIQTLAILVIGSDFPAASML